MSYKIRIEDDARDLDFQYKWLKRQRDNRKANKREGVR